ncbi:MAG: hypothetical protein ACW986_03025 [Promethearchaeota archaeon]|jgi:hypothetical protein
MKYNLTLDYNKLLGRTTLLYGEANTKKTLLTSKFVQFLLESKNIPPKDITILDFAPNLIMFKDLKIGGKVRDFYKLSSKCRYPLIKGEIIPPRLNSKNKKELYKFACENFRKTYEILNSFIKDSTPLLIINDISIYLHIGSTHLILKAIFKSSTFFGNSYYGTSIKSDYSSLFSLREKQKVASLIKRVDKSYSTD